LSLINLPQFVKLYRGKILYPYSNNDVAYSGFETYLHLFFSKAKATTFKEDLT